MILPILLCHLLSDAEIQVDPNKVLNSISGDLYGSCIEDVNHEIYGGLYAQRIFGESFEEPGEVVGQAGWRTLGGDWKSSGGVVECPAGNGPMLVLEGKTVSDGWIEAKVRVDQGQDGSAGILVRVSHASLGIDTFDGYEIAFQAKSGILALSRHRHDYHPLFQVPAPITTGTTHLIRVQLQGPRIRVFLDQEEIPRIDFVDRDNPLLSGSIALRPWQTSCQYRDVKFNHSPVSLTLSNSGLSRMWDPIGHPRFTLEHPGWNGLQCQKIVNDGTQIVGVANRGLNRWGISVRKSVLMTGRIALRGDVRNATVALQSVDGRHTYASQQLIVTHDWRSRSFQFKPSTTDRNARFVVLSSQPGALFVDQAVLMDGDRLNDLPIRGDIARAMVAENLTFLRYGGTMVNFPGYRWKKMIGPPDKRPPYQGNWYPNSTNCFGIFDFLNFSEAAYFRSAFAINIEESAQDAEDLADYLTAPITNKWGALRAADGHPAPYHPEYIEIGNEEGIGSSPHAELAHYIERFLVLEKAIHRRAPKLKLVCAAWWTQDMADMKQVFQSVEKSAAAWDIHVGSDDPNSGQEVDRELTEIEKAFKTWNPTTKLKVVVFEENGGLHNLQRALGHATTLNATRRHGAFVLADCPANCLQPWKQNDNGWDQGQVFFTPSQVWGMPPYYAQQILSQDRQPLRIASQASPLLDVVATRSNDGKCIAVTAVNLSDHSVPTHLTANHFHPGIVSATGISGELSAENSPTHPKSLVPKSIPTTQNGNIVTLTLPAHSITSIRLVRSVSD